MISRYKQTMTEYSERMLARILERRPDWKDLVRENSDEGEEYFEIHIPSPVANQPNLMVESFMEELSIYWDAWHDHIWAYEDEDEELKMLFDKLERLFTEHDVIACEYRVDEHGVRQWASSTSGHPDDITLPNYGTEWIMMSWLGTLSKTSNDTTSS